MPSKETDQPCALRVLRVTSFTLYTQTSEAGPDTCRQLQKDNCQRSCGNLQWPQWDKKKLNSCCLNCCSADRLDSQKLFIHLKLLVILPSLHLAQKWIVWDENTLASTKIAPIHFNIIIIEPQAVKINLNCCIIYPTRINSVSNQRSKIHKK